MELILITLLFIIGSSIGSFLNVLIMRTVDGEQWVKGRSKCDHCRKNLSWYDNIPLLSFLVLGGKSRCCKKKLSIQYPIVEGMTGLLFVWWWVMGRAFFLLIESPMTVIQPLYWLIVGLLFIGILFADLYYGIIPDILVIVGYVITVIYTLILAGNGDMQWLDLGYSYLSLIGSYLFFLFLHKITREKGMGFGDVKLAGVLGLILGYPLIIISTFLSFVLGSIVGLLLILLGKRKLGQTIPFGPFMITAAAISLIWGDMVMKFLFPWM